MQALFDILKIITGLAVIVGISFYWLNHRSPPRGRGRWHQAQRTATGAVKAWHPISGTIVAAAFVTPRRASRSGLGSSHVPRQCGHIPGSQR